MADIEVIVNSDDLKALASNIERAKRVMLGRMAERGYQLLRREVPKQTTNLQQGIAQHIENVNVPRGVKVTTSENRQGTTEVDYEALEATLTVSARSARSGGGTATIHGPDGKVRRQVSISPQPAYNYADVVARGNKKTTLTPTRAKAFLIPVTVAPQGESYVSISGEKFIVRRSKKGMRANPFHIRAAKRLDLEAALIAEGVVKTLEGK